VELVVEAELHRITVQKYITRRGRQFTGQTSTSDSLARVAFLPAMPTKPPEKGVSNSLHAEKGRAYLWKQHPELAQRLVPARAERGLGRLPRAELDTPSLRCLKEARYLTMMNSDRAVHPVGMVALPAGRYCSKPLLEPLTEVPKT
jgi:hypothetical protein